MAFPVGGHKYWGRASVQTLLWLKEKYGNLYWQVTLPVGVSLWRVRHGDRTVTSEILRYIEQRKPEDWQAIISEPVVLRKILKDDTQIMLRFWFQRFRIPIYMVMWAVFNPIFFKRLWMMTNAQRSQPLYPAHTQLYWSWGYRRVLDTMSLWRMRWQIDANLRRQKLGPLDNFYLLDRSRLKLALQRMLISPFA